MCRKCLGVIYDREECSCKNVGVILDEDDIPHIYVDDITSVQRCLVYMDKLKEIRRELLQSFNQALYADYNVRHKPFVTKKKWEKEDYVKRTTNVYDKALMKALDRDIYKTSDGKEVFKRLALMDNK